MLGGDEYPEEPCGIISLNGLANLVSDKSQVFIPDCVGDKYTTLTARTSAGGRCDGC